MGEPKPEKEEPKKKKPESNPVQIDPDGTTTENDKFSVNMTAGGNKARKADNSPSKIKAASTDKTTPTYKQKNPSKGIGLTISSDDNSKVHRSKFPKNTGATISTYDGGETGPKNTSQIYQDPNTGSTIATKQARTNISEGKDYVIKSSTYSPEYTTPITKTKMHDTRPGDLMFDGRKSNTYQGPDTQSYNLDIINKQKELISEPRPSKDLITGENLKYSGPESTTSINKINPSLRRALLGSSSGSVLRRITGL
jgi:hypothetical protein